MKRKNRAGADHPTLFDGEAQDRGGHEESVLVVTSVSEVFELARKHLGLASNKLAGARRRLRAHVEGADVRGLVAKWAVTRGYILIHDPLEGEWWDVPWTAAPTWARWESRRRRDLYKSGDRRAYERSSREMAELWESEHPPEPETGIVEEHPVEE